jgi:hypothetical protein
LKTYPLTIVCRKGLPLGCSPDQPDVTVIGDDLYSPRNTRIGSMEVARLAGSSDASKAATIRTATLNPMAHGSTALVSYNMLCTQWVAAVAPSRPNIMPPIIG